MHALPNPFTDSAASDAAGGYGRRTSAPLPPDATVGPNSALERAIAADAAAAPDLTDPPVAVAELIHDPAMETGGPQEAPAVPPNPMAAGATDHRFELDEGAFAAELADETVRQELAMRMPTFLSAPSQEYLRAVGA